MVKREKYQKELKDKIPGEEEVKNVVRCVKTRILLLKDSPED